MPYASENGVVNGVLPTSVTALYIQVLPGSNPADFQRLGPTFYFIKCFNNDPIFKFLFKKFTGIDHKKPKVNLQSRKSFL